MYVYRTPLCYCVHETGLHQLAMGEKFLKGVLLSQPHEQTCLVTHLWLSCSQRCSRILRLGWETMKRYLRIILGNFTIGFSGNQTGNCHFTNRGNYKILSDKCAPRTGGLTNPRTWRGRFRAGSSNTGGPPLPRKRAPFTKKCAPLWAVGLFLWLGARRYWDRDRKFYICLEPRHQPLNFPPKLGFHTFALQGMLWLQFSIPLNTLNICNLEPDKQAR